MREKRVLLATRSAGKLRELQGLLNAEGMHGITLADAGIEYSPEEEEIEAFETFEENARAKAMYFYAKSGLPTFADDSGLSVVALNGAPGVWSKRYSGRKDLEGQALDDANNAKLISTLRGFRDTSASYTCAAACEDEHVHVVRTGKTFGRIISEPKGLEGFGYDPYFFSTDLQKTFAEAGIAEKASVSHRGRAFKALLAAMKGEQPEGMGYNRAEEMMIDEYLQRFPEDKAKRLKIILMRGDTLAGSDPDGQAALNRIYESRHRRLKGPLHLRNDVHLQLVSTDGMRPYDPEEQELIAALLGKVPEEHRADLNKTLMSRSASSVTMHDPELQKLVEQINERRQRRHEAADHTSERVREVIRAARKKE